MAKKTNTTKAARGGSKIVTDPKVLNKKWGRAFAEWRARENAAEAERLRQELADTVREAAQDVGTLEQELRTAQMWTRYERRKRERERRAFADTLVLVQQSAERKRTSEPELLQIHFVAQRLGISVTTARAWLSNGRLPLRAHKANPKVKQSPTFYEWDEDIARKAMRR